MNQPVRPDGRGGLYSGVLDCLRKTLQTEGPLALYKGVTASYARE